MYDFSKKYNRKNFLDFLKNLLPDDLILKEKEYKDETKKDLIKKIYKLGEVKSLDQISILEVEHSSINDPRISLTKKVFSVFNKLSINKALVIFFCSNSDNYRFSLIESSFEWKNDTDISKEFSTPKRLSFFLGKEARLHTAHNQFKTKVKDYKDLKNRFNIEIVNDEFFNQYKNLYLSLHNNLKKDKKFISFINEKKIKTFIFAKKLLGQIVFCYFLQKKGCLGAEKNQTLGAGNKNFLRDQFSKCEKQKKNFYNDFLEYFFYDGLNSENVNNYVESIKCKTPYLNGGLFEEISGYDWKKESLKLSNDLFSNKSEEGILDIFDLYNFTVDENDGFDIEIGIDPEMLGKVFENLLPENFRKGKGSFYTPRKIVKFMCLDAIRNYLISKTELNKEKDLIEKLIELNSLPLENKSSEYNLNFDKTLLNTVDQYLKNIKICDPAIGSGAFPVQLMNEIVGIRGNILGILNKEFSNYSLKRDFIENSIYGVDIDKGAVEISKLRLWLSLIVDEKNINNINPLPNLSYKILQGNSLIQKYKNYDFDNEYEKTELFPDEETINIKKELIEIQKKYFNLTSRKRKKETRELLDKKIESLISKENKHNFLMDEERNFFLWKIFFLDVFQNGGFDLIIGNPPYVFARSSKEKGITEEDKKYFYKNYSLIDYKINYYILFIEIATKILKKSGYISFIIPNNWMTISTNESMRKFILDKKNITIINCIKKVFISASVDASIVAFENSNSTESELLLMEYDDNFKKIAKTKTSFFKNGAYIINFELVKNKEIAKLFWEIEKKSIKISQISKVRQGLIAYGVGGGIPKQNKKMKDDKIYHSEKKLDDSYYKYLESNDIHRYKFNWSGQFLKYGDNLFRKREFNIYQGERLLIKQIPSDPPYCISATYTNETILNDVNSIIIHDIRIINPKSLVAILNSKLISFWFILKFGKMQRSIFPQFKINELAQFPIPKNISDNRMLKKLANLANEKMGVKNSDKVDKEIDTLVYELFKLDKKDILTVENYLNNFGKKN